MNKPKPLYVVTENREAPKYYECSIEATEDYFSRYANGSRELTEYIPCEILVVRDAIDKLRSVLLDPDGFGSIEGSEYDNAIITNAMKALKQLEASNDSI